MLRLLVLLRYACFIRNVHNVYIVFLVLNVTVYARLGVPFGLLCIELTRSIKAVITLSLTLQILLQPGAVACGSETLIKVLKII